MPEACLRHDVRGRIERRRKPLPLTRSHALATSPGLRGEVKKLIPAPAHGPILPAPLSTWDAQLSGFAGQGR